MWFCCQIWQCNLKTCLGPLEIWKTWNGWSHVVYPSKGNETSKTFAGTRSPDMGREIILHQQRPFSLEDPKFAHVLKEDLNDESQILVEEKLNEVPDEGRTMNNVEIYTGSNKAQLSDKRSLQDSTSQEFTSTELSALGTKMEYWSQLDTHRIDQEQTCRSKCSDVSSLEEYQYRQLWNLRAMLAKNENSSFQELSNAELLSPNSYVCGGADQPRAMNEIHAVCCEGLRSHVCQQVYSNEASSAYHDLHCMQSRQGSQESFDTLDTEASSTDTSLKDKARSQKHALGNQPTEEEETCTLQQLHGDDGHGSMENLSHPYFVSQQPLKEVTRQPVPTVPLELNTSHFYSSTDLEVTAKVGAMLEGRIERLPYANRSDISADVDVRFVPKTETNSTWNICQIKNKYSASRKRHEFGIGRCHRALAQYVSEVDHPSSSYYERENSEDKRDYSIPLKSYELFCQYQGTEPFTDTVKMRSRHVMESRAYSRCDCERFVSESSSSSVMIPVITLGDSGSGDDDCNEDK